MRKLFFFVTAAALIQPTIALAQGQSLACLGLKCSDFQKNEDGTWSPTHAVSIPADGATLSVSKKDILGPNTSIGGLHLGVMVNAECAAH